MNATKAMDWIRLVFAQIDRVIYWLISVTYSIIVELSNISIFTNENIEEFAGRIYVFLGVIMLFKVTFSLITYLVDPDAISDKTRGTGNLAKNIIITLFLIIIVPYGFDLLYNAQSAIISDNLIPKLILGTNDTETTSLSVNMDPDVCGDSVATVSSYGDYIAQVSLRPFLQVYDELKTDNLLSTEEKLAYCEGDIKLKLSQPVLYADTAVLNTGQYIFEYNFFISTVFGAIIFLLLLNFCFDIAVRTIKLGFLEIIAPIPIISYIDPKSGKDGIFKKWFREVTNTWASLFIRLAAIYFAVYVITMINQNVEAIKDENGYIIMLFLIIGALMFAKQAPGLIESVFGIKLSHTVQLNPLKKISDQALGGKELVQFGRNTVGGIVGTAGGALAGYKAGSEVGNIKKGMLVGAFNGFSAGRSNPKGAFSKSLDQTYKNLTGNELARLSVSKMIMGKQAGEEAVGEIKTELAKAREQLRMESTKLNQASNLTAELGNELSRRGINVNNLPKIGEIENQLVNLRRALNTAKTNYDNKNKELGNFKNKYNMALEQYNKDKELVENYKIGNSSATPSEFAKAQQNMTHFESQKGGFEAALKKLEKEKNSLSNSINGINNNIRNNEQLIEYQKAYNQEIESRKILGDIEKDIKTLENEKSQRERFYQVDKSTTKSVSDAKASIAKRDANYGIQRDNNGKIIQ